MECTNINQTICLFCILCILLPLNEMKDGLEFLKEQPFYIPFLKTKLKDGLEFTILLPLNELKRGYDNITLLSI